MIAIAAATVLYLCIGVLLYHFSAWTLKKSTNTTMEDLVAEEPATELIGGDKMIGLVKCVMAIGWPYFLIAGIIKTINDARRDG